MRLRDAIVAQGHTILPAGKELTQADVDALRQRFAGLVVRVHDPVLDDAFEFEDDTHDRTVAQHAQQRVVQVMTNVSERFLSRSSLAEVNFAAMQASLSEVIDYLRANPVSTALLARGFSSKTYLTDRAGNLFYLSMLLGSAIRDRVRAERERMRQPCASTPATDINLLPLGLGAMFIDVGMYALQELFRGDRPLSRPERQTLREHPRTGAKMLPDDLPPLVRMVVQTHHENLDGSGYPEKLSGEAVHLFARIVRIADAFDAATAQRVYREAVSPVRALWQMTKGIYRRHYDPVLMKVFARLIQPFPIGARLRLQDGRYVIVVKYNRRNPFLPTVVVAFGADGERLPSHQLIGPLELDQHCDLRLASYAGEDLSYLYDTSFFEALAPVRGDFATLYEAAFP